MRSARAKAGPASAASALGLPLSSTATLLRNSTGTPLRVSFSTPTGCVAPLDKGVAKAGPMSAANALGLACEAHLAVNVDKLTELAIIRLKEH